MSITMTHVTSPPHGVKHPLRYLCWPSHSDGGTFRPHPGRSEEGDPLTRSRELTRSMTSFIGRRREIEEARARLQQSRLVSLLGAGGVGKTRLAEELAVRSARAFRDSVRWIDLAPVRDPDALPSAAAAALGVTDQSSRAVMDKVIDQLQSRHLLIVLDNCEHLLSAAREFVGTVLASAPEVRILTTSREPLGIAGE